MLMRSIHKEYTWPDKAKTRDPRERFERDVQSVFACPVDCCWLHRRDTVPAKAVGPIILCRTSHNCGPHSSALPERTNKREAGDQPVYIVGRMHHVAIHRAPCRVQEVRRPHSSKQRAYSRLV